MTTPRRRRSALTTCRRTLLDHHLPPRRRGRDGLLQCSSHLHSFVENPNRIHLTADRPPQPHQRCLRLSQHTSPLPVRVRGHRWVWLLTRHRRTGTTTASIRTRRGTRTAGQTRHRQPTGTLRSLVRHSTSPRQDTRHLMARCLSPRPPRRRHRNFLSTAPPRGLGSPLMAAVTLGHLQATISPRLAYNSRGAGARSLLRRHNPLLQPSRGQVNTVLGRQRPVLQRVHGQQRRRLSSLTRAFGTRGVPRCMGLSSNPTKCRVATRRQSRVAPSLFPRQLKPTQDMSPRQVQVPGTHHHGIPETCRLAATPRRDTTSADLPRRPDRDTPVPILGMCNCGTPGTPEIRAIW